MRKILTLLSLIIALAVPLFALAESATVVDVVDGDTLRVQVSGATEKVRIIGIDTPETVDPRKPVQCFGKEASDHMKQLLSGKSIELETNPAEDKDVYGRLLRYVQFDGEDVGATMVRDGYAYSYRKYPHPRLEAYNAFEQEARSGNKGLWGKCGDSAGQEIFTDVPSNHPYIEAIQWGKTASVLSGYPDGTFQPEKAVNRAELLKIMLGAKGADTGNDNVALGFSDVDESAWYAPFIRYGKQHGIIQGYADGSFRPNQTVNFAEALKMAYLIFDIDTPEMSGEWYSRFLNHARQNGVLFNDNIDVASGMARKDVVWVAYKLTHLGDTPAVPPVPSPSASSEAADEEPSECLIKGNISAQGERIFHMPGCGSYEKTVIDASTGERWFCSEKEAIAAGWRKALNCP